MCGLSRTAWSASTTASKRGQFRTWTLGREWKVSASTRLAAGLDLLNVTNEKGLYNFLSTSAAPTSFHRAP
jgi:hypothetical protein